MIWGECDLKKKMFTRIYICDSYIFKKYDKPGAIIYSTSSLSTNMGGFYPKKGRYDTSSLPLQNKTDEKVYILNNIPTISKGIKF